MAILLQCNCDSGFSEIEKLILEKIDEAWNLTCTNTEDLCSQESVYCEEFECSRETFSSFAENIVITDISCDDDTPPECETRNISVSLFYSQYLTFFLDVAMFIELF